MPLKSTAKPRSEVAIGRRMNGAETFTLLLLRALALSFSPFLLFPRIRVFGRSRACIAYRDRRPVGELCEAGGHDLVAGVDAGRDQARVSSCWVTVTFRIATLSPF